MSARYLVPCPACGASQAVEIGRAGDRVNCSCGQVIDVPTMRELQRLPPAAASGDPSTSRDPRSSAADPSYTITWGPRQGLMFLGLLLLIAGFAPAMFLTINFPEPQTRSKEESSQITGEAVDRLTLSQSWEIWKVYIEGRGLSRELTLQEAGYQRRAEHLREWITIFWVISAIGGLMLIVSFFVSVKRD